MKKGNSKVKTLFLVTLSAFIILILQAGFTLGFAPSSVTHCYTRITLNESLVYDDYGNVTDLNLAFASQENLYGNYESFINNYDSEVPETYILRVYNTYNQTLGNYSLSTSLLVYYDNFGNETDPGGVILLNESQNSLIIPYFPSISKITIQSFNGTERVLTGFNPSLVSCVRTCKNEGETGIFANDTCCEGFAQVQKDENSFVCIKVGDGICNSSIGEDRYNSYSDCAVSFNFFCLYGSIKTQFGCVSQNVCGNNVLEFNNTEECDDGNNDNGDGCTFDCVLENSTSTCREYNSFSVYNTTKYVNTCTLNGGINQYYCGYNLFRLDFWNVFTDKVIKTRTINCAYGCSNGVCLPQLIINSSLNQTIPINSTINNTNSQADLPPEPQAPPK